MPPTRPHRFRRAVSPVSTWLIAVLATVALLVPMQVAAPSASAQPAYKMADLSKFDAGNIVSDAVFFARGTMTEAQIQSFLEQQVPTCRSGYTCLKDWSDTSRSVAADQMCSAYAGGTRERASRIIYKVAQACGINPQVLLVMLQKEQGLVTHVWPSDWRFRIAMGQGCPDTAGCDSRYYGFFNQMYGAAWQMKRYANPPGTSKFFTWYPPRQTSNILYHPNHGCGRGPVYLANQATANLYYYTPYQPNKAALSAGYGLGDHCSSYGNRNFFNYFTDWFGSTQALTTVQRLSGHDRYQTAVAVTKKTYPSGASTVYLASGTAFPDALSVAPRAAKENAALLLTPGNSLPTAVANELKRLKPSKVVLVGGTGAIDNRMDDRVHATLGSGVSVTRLGGADRFETSRRVAEGMAGKTAYLVTGLSFPDALGAGAAAGQAGAPVILVNGTRSTLDSATLSLLRSRGTTKVVIVGGTGVVSSGISAQLSGQGISVTRYGGSNRFDTNAALNRAVFPGGRANVVVSAASDFPDALAGSVLAAKKSAPLFVSKSTCLSAAAADYLAARTGTVVSLIGGSDALGGGVAALRRC